MQPGGVWSFEMVGPDGEEYPNRIAYDAVQEPERLAYTHGSSDEPEQFQVTLSLEDAGDGETVLTMEMRFPAATDLDEAVEFGAVDGANQTLNRLAEHLAMD